MKYIRHKTQGFYLFPSKITHTDFALDNNLIIKADIISAGFINCGECGGKSVSTGITAGTTDTADLRKQMETGEI